MFFEKQRFSSTDMYIYIEFRRLDRFPERIKSLSLSRISQCFFFCLRASMVTIKF